MSFASYLDPSRRDESRRCGGLGRLGRLRRTLPPRQPEGFVVPRLKGCPIPPDFLSSRVNLTSSPAPPHPFHRSVFHHFRISPVDERNCWPRKPARRPAGAGAAARCNPVNAPVRARMRGLRRQALSRLLRLIASRTLPCCGRSRSGNRQLGPGWMQGLDAVE
jgi:hypothetical protein